MAMLDKVKGWFKKSSEAKHLEAARGIAIPPSPAGAATDAMSGYGGLLGGGSAGAAPWDSQSPLAASLKLSDELLERYVDYEAMACYDLTSAALTVYADDATIPDSTSRRTVWASSADRLVRDLLEDLLTRRLNIETHIHGLARSLAEYGDQYGEILVTEGGVVGLNFLQPPTMRVIQEAKGALLGYVQAPLGRFAISQKDFDKALATPRPQRAPTGGCVVFEPWEVAHWRLSDSTERAAYGTSILASARWAWKRLIMLEDTALVTKLTRGPSRYAYYIDTGDLPPAEGLAYVKAIQKQYTRKKVINPSTGMLDFRYNVANNSEDLWLPSRGGKDSTRVDVLAGIDTQDLEVVEYFRNKVLASTLVPRRFLGLEEQPGRVTSQDDVRFARSCMRLQRALVNGLKQVCRVHLAALGVDPDAVKWDLHMVVPSYIFELAQLEVKNAQAQLAQGLGELMPPPWILQHVFGFSQDEAIYTTDEARKARGAAMKADASAQAEIMRDYPETVTGIPPGQEAAMGMEPLPGEEGEEEVAAEAVAAPRAPAWARSDADALRHRLDRLITETGRMATIAQRTEQRLDNLDRQAARDARRLRAVEGGRR
jgi:hypothetical protein